MKATKKLLALVLALTMILALGTTAFAEDEEINVPSADDKADVSVLNVESEATVTLYKIVNPVYNTAGLAGYEPVIANSIANVEAPTAEEVADLAQIAGSTELQAYAIAVEQDDGSYLAEDVGAGTYLVLVEGSAATIYNPMIVSVNYDEKSETVDGEVDAKSFFVLNDQNVYAKSTTPDVDKKIVDSDGNENGNDVAIGDTVNFEIDTAIPSYSDQYTNVTFNISDTLSEGFNAPSNIVVLVGGVAPAEGAYTLTTSGNSFTISFDSDYIKANGLKNVVVTYSAVVNENAELNFDPNTNTAKIVFTNDPTEGTGYKEDKTYTYTFAIDGNLSEKSTTTPYKTHEIIKINQDGSVEVVSSEDVPLDEIEVEGPLAGAVFTLTAEDGTVYTATSNADGYLDGFTGLDAGTYTLVEKTAPEGFVVDPTEHTVEISATYNDDGTLASYTIKIDGKDTSTYTATYEGGEITEFKGTSQDTLAIQNTEIKQLPSTGGIGTTLFYVFGGLMVVAAGVVLVTKKRMGTEG